MPAGYPSFPGMSTGTYPSRGIAGYNIPYTGGASTGYSGITSPSPAVGQAYNLYGAGVNTGAQQLGTLTSGYQALPQTAQRYAPQPFQYTPSPAATSAITNLSGLASTGGYSPTDIAAIRERAISPIRSLYAGAQQNLARNRALSGGYAPGYDATTARMTRDLGQQISDTSTNINAQLAQQIASGRLSAASPFASAALGESGTAAGFGKSAQDILNEAQMYNIQLPTSMQERSLAGLAGLYGARPGLAETFGSQALSTAQLQDMIDRSANQQGLTALGYAMRGM